MPISMLMDAIQPDRDLLVLQKLPERKSIRAKWHDYCCGKYFVTVCAHDMRCSFGRIAEREIFLYGIGKEVAAAIEDMPSHFADVDVVEYVVMPNHFHAIIHIESETSTADEDPTPRVNNRLAVAVGTIKARVTRYARRNGIPFQWQRGFHDRIIRNRNEYHEIRKYIQGNVTRWSDDRYYQNIDNLPPRKNVGLRQK